MDGHRYKILPIPYEQILNLLYPIHDVNIINKIKLPEDVSVVTVYYEPNKKEFLMVLESDEFPIVEDRACYPILDFSSEYIKRYQIVG